MAGRCQFLGQVQHDAVPGWIASANLLVLPSLREGCPNVVLESLASGTPVIASSVGAIPDIVGHDSGILVPPNDPEGLAAALGEGIDRNWDPMLISRSVSQLTWEAAAAGYLELIEQAVDDARGMSDPSRHATSEMA